MINRRRDRLALARSFRVSVVHAPNDGKAPSSPSAPAKAPAPAPGPQEREKPPLLLDGAGHRVCGDGGPWFHVGASIPGCPVVATLGALAQEPDVDLRIEWAQRAAELPLEAEDPP